MVLEEILNTGYIISLLISSVVAWIAIMISDKIIAHNTEPKKSLIMAIVALFLTPMITGVLFSILSVPVVFVAGFNAITGLLLPLLVWIILGELLLQSDRMTKLKVAAIGFVVYLILSIALVPAISGFIPF